MDGLDTGFFYAFLAGDEQATELWREIARQDRAAAVSSVTLFELLRHGLQGRLDRTFAEQTVQRAGVAYKQAGMDRVEVLERAARIAHGMGLAMADAMIAASLEEIGCERLYTADRDFERYGGPMEIGFL